MNTDLLIPEGDRQRLTECKHHAPHDFYGWHRVGAGSVVRTRFLGAERVELLIHNGARAMELIGDDIWAISLDDEHAPDYRFRVTYPGAEPRIVADAYHFLPTLGSLDLHLINEGRHERLWEVLGANVRSYETSLGEVRGTSFAVWAPNAQGVAVIGDFCEWNPNQYPMRSLGSSGVWEIFIPGIGDGATYKYAIQTADGTRVDLSLIHI